MKNFKNFSLTVIILPFVAFAVMIAVNLALDPYHIFKKGAHYPFIGRTLKHYDNAGIINNYDIKSIIVGGSLMDNFVPSEIETALHWPNTYLLTLNDADAASIAAISQYAMQRHAVQHALFGLQPTRVAEIASDREAKRGAAKNFMYLYDDNRLNDLLVFLQMPDNFIKAYLNEKKQRADLRKSFPGLTDATIRTASEDLYSTYMPEHYREFNRPLFISSIVDQNEPRHPVTEEEKKNLVENYDANIRPLVERNPSVEFDFVVAPESFVQRKSDRDMFVYALDFLVRKLSAYKNVKIYGFSNDAFNADLRLFKDLNHFHIEVSRFMIRSIANDDHRLTASNVGAYIDDFNRIMDAYQVPALWKTSYYPLHNGPYPKGGYLTYHDAAKLVWGPKFSEDLYSSIPRSRYLAESGYVTGDGRTWPPLNASRQMLQNAGMPRGNLLDTSGCSDCPSKTASQEPLPHSLN